jgi:hypothetical protein
MNIVVAAAALVLVSSILATIAVTVFDVRLFAHNSAHARARRRHARA